MTSNGISAPPAVSAASWPAASAANASSVAWSVVLCTPADSSRRVPILYGEREVAGCSAFDVGQMRDVVDIVRVGARGTGEPRVEDLLELGHRGGAQAQRQHVGVVPLTRPVGGRRVGAQGCPDPGDLVGGD